MLGEQPGTTPRPNLVDLGRAVAVLRTHQAGTLRAVQAGQTVTVVDGGGKQLKFVVDQVLTVGKDNLPQHADELFGQTGPHRLVLVTCGGKWVGGALGYDQNRVVIAHPVS